MAVIGTMPRAASPRADAVRRTRYPSVDDSEIVRGERREPRGRRAIGAALLLLSSGCGDAPVTPVGPTPAPIAAPREQRELDALFVGCHQVRPGPVCAFDPETAEIRVWVEVEPSLTPTLEVDGKVGEPVPVEGGVRWSVRPSAEARELRVDVDLDGAHGRLTLELRPEPEPGLDDPVVARINAGALAWQEGDHDAAAREYADAYALAEARGRRREASTLAQALVHYDLEQSYDVGSARRWLERDAAMVEGDPQQTMMHAFSRGLVAEHVGDVRGALEAYNEGARQARAVGLDELERAILPQQLILVGALGAWEQARELRERVMSLLPDADPVTRAQLLNNVAWMLLEARARGRETDDPVPLLRQALPAVREREDALSQRTRAAIRLDLAYAAVLEGDATQAERWLDELRGTSLHHEDRLWRELLLARVAGLRGDPARAERRFGALLAEADRAHEPELRWHALLGRGQAQEAAGRSEAARHSYVAAERLLDEQLPRLAMGQSRARFMAERARGAQRLVDLLLRLDRRDEALCAARIARGRVLRTIAQQLRSMADATPEQRQALERHRDARARIEKELDESWSLPTAAGKQRRRELEHQRQEDQRAFDRLLAELRPAEAAPLRCADLGEPGPGRLDLHFARLDDGWVGFGHDAEGLVVHRLGPISVGDGGPATWPALGAALLEPFASELQRAEQVRVMASGELLHVPFHALPFPGSPERMLVDVVAVGHGLDLAAAPQAGAEADRVAVIVGPPSNLRHAPAEIDDVSRRLDEAGWTVRRIEGDAATGATVRAALPSADLMHYVGHARSDGIGGWSSALTLARDSSLGVADVLALPQVPRSVVLNGCETGRADPQALAGGMSMAHAFVLGGAELVVAADRELDDAAAAALMRAFYEARATEGSALEALRVALRERRGQDDGWLIVRGWVP